MKESLSGEREAMKHGFVDGMVNTLIRDQSGLAWSLSSSALNSVPQLRHRYMPTAPPSIRSTSFDPQFEQEGLSMMSGESLIGTTIYRGLLDK